MPLAVATKTVQNVVDYVTRQFGDESGAQITETDITRWTNAAQLEIARQTEFSQEVATTVSVANQEGYSLPGVNILVIKSVYYKGKPLDHRSFNEFQESILGALTSSDPTTGVPVVWYEWKDSIYLWPVPDTADDEIKLYFIKQPDELLHTTDVLTVPDQYWAAVIQFVMAQAYELDDDMQGSAYKNRQLQELLGGVDTEASQKYYPVVTVLNEDSEF